MRILVVGAFGQVGSRVVSQALRAGHSVVASYNARPATALGASEVHLDKTQPELVERAIAQARPEVVIDTGALHNVDYCETHPTEAFAVNRDGTEVLARTAHAVGARFIFVSTDFVFDGSGNPPYAESDAPHPQSVYAASKLEGETAALRVNPNSAVARPSVVYSWATNVPTSASASAKPLNFGSWFLRQMVAGKPVRVVTDQIGSPTLADDLARALLQLAQSSATGVFHTAGTSALSRYDFCRRLIDRFELPAELLASTSSSEFHQVAPRPKNSSLSSTRLFDVVGYSMLGIDGALDELQQAILSDPESPQQLRQRR